MPCLAAAKKKNRREKVKKSWDFPVLCGLMMVLCGLMIVFHEAFMDMMSEKRSFFLTIIKPSLIMDNEIMNDGIMMLNDGLMMCLIGIGGNFRRFHTDQ